MISVISITADDPTSQKSLMAEYLPEDKTLVLSIDGYEQPYTFTITESATAITIGKFLCECGIDIEELEDELAVDGAVVVGLDVAAGDLVLLLTRDDALGDLLGDGPRAARPSRARPSAPSRCTRVTSRGP